MTLREWLKAPKTDAYLWMAVLGAFIIVLVGMMVNLEWVVLAGCAAGMVAFVLMMFRERLKE